MRREMNVLKCMSESRRSRSEKRIMIFKKYDIKMRKHGERKKCDEKLNRGIHQIGKKA